MTKLLGSWDPLILGVLELLGLELPLGVVGLAVEFVPKVCSGHWSRQTRRNPCHWSGGVPACGVQLVPVVPCVGTDPPHL